MLHAGLREMGAAGAQALDVAAREAMEAQRKFVRGYRNAKIMQGVYGVERARAYVPRSRGVGGEVGGGAGRISGAVGDGAGRASGGEVRSGRETFLKREK